MTTDRGALAALLATLAVMSATPTVAQTAQPEQTPQPAPVRGLEALAPSQATQIPVPDAPKIVLPSTTPRAPRTTPPASKATAKNPTISDRPATRATAPQSAPRAPSAGDTNTTAEPRASTTSPTAAEPAPAMTPAPVPTPTAPLTTTDAAPTATPAPTATQGTTLAAPETGRAMPLWLSLAVIVVVLAGLWFLRRRKRAARYDRAALEVIPEPTPDFAEQPVTPPPPEPVTTPVATPIAAPVAAPAVFAPTAPKFLEPRTKTPPPPPAAARARITCELRPLRAGLNLLSATVECELVITNTGNAAAESIRTGIALLTAHADQDADLAAFNAAWVARPAAAPFTLAPDETRTIRTVVAIARDAIRTMTAANRPMFVPVVATNILYTTAGDDAQTARAWVVGIERVDSPKLAPFWLDAPARMFTTIAARPHAATFDR